MKKIALLALAALALVGCQPAAAPTPSQPVNQSTTGTVEITPPTSEQNVTGSVTINPAE